MIRSEDIRKRVKDIDEYLSRNTKKANQLRNEIGEHMNSN